MASQDPTEALVDEIVSRVTAQLGGQLAAGASNRVSTTALKLTSSSGGQVGSDPTEPCHATDATCTGCGFCTTRKEGVVDTLVHIGAARIASSPGGIKPREDLASVIDHTI
jgi:hypothetical protein